MKRKAIRTIHVFAMPGNRHKGVLVAGRLVLACALGRSGITHCKREGDGGTPAGWFSPRQLMYRPDAGRRPATLLPLRPIRPDDGWCDASGDRNYNRPVRRPYAASSEALWRADRLYDLVIDIGHNRSSRVQGRGSAIFLHVARQGPGRTALAATEGCIALPQAALRKLLACMGKSTRIGIGEGCARGAARAGRASARVSGAGGRSWHRRGRRQRRPLAEDGTADPHMRRP
jgi:L,D-peptidoglycan transpeptidase YkuD (ErfK/YbiS/YcfS/YnhG family)